MRAASRALVTAARIAAFCLLGITAQPGIAAPAPTPIACRGEAPRVGLALSGGGARGAAHVGVLEVLEQLRVPVGCIAGTSMGAVVGGLYAAGKSPEELRRTLAELPWSDLFRDQPPRAARSFRRKQDDREYLSSLELGFENGRFALPRGLIQGQKLARELALLTLPVATTRSFDALPIPFRAIVTNVETGRPRALDSGELATAIRASMSVPAAFAPVEIDGELYVDGGVVQNLPVETVARMGADVIIAVDIATRLESQAKLGSALSISGQSFTIAIVVNSRRSAEQLDLERDLLVRPDLGTIRAGDFHRVLEAADVGSEAMRELAARLERYALPPEEFEAHLAGQRRSLARPPMISAIRIENESALSEAALLARIDTRAGSRLDVPTLRRDLDRLYGLDTFDMIDLSLSSTDGEIEGAELLLRIHPRDRGRNRIRTGIDLNTDFVGKSFFNLKANATRLPLNGFVGEWRTRVSVGRETGITSEIYQPLDAAGRWFVAPLAGISIRELDLFRDGRQVATFRAWSGHVELGAGRALGNWGELRAGIFYGGGQATPQVGAVGQPTSDLHEGGLLARLQVDTLDNPIFPTRGSQGELAFAFERPEFGAQRTTSSIRFSANHALSFGRTTLIPGFQLAGALRGASGDIERLFPLGGFLRLSGMAPNQIAGPYMGLARLIVHRAIATPRIFTFEIPVYLGLSAETGGTWQTVSEIDADSLLWSGGAFLGLETFLGPLFLGYGHTRGGNNSAYLFLGQPF